jgi:HSP20 family molecular chaperone IbpA
MLVRSSLSALDRSFDRTFDQLTAGLLSTAMTTRRQPPEVRAHHDDQDHDALVLSVDLPGVPAEAVSVDVAGRSLTLGVDTETLQWSRSLQLGPALDPEKVTARHLDGRLTVHIGSVDAPEPRSITIDTTPVVGIDQPIDALTDTPAAQDTDAERGVQSNATNSGDSQPRD